MVRGSQKSRTKRRVYVKVPSGSKLMYKKRKPSKHVCANCGKQLLGIPHKIKSKYKNLPKSSKRPSRPFGGVLCSSCTRKELMKRMQNV